jgi:opacity protein-like surface antigen
LGIFLGGSNFIGDVGATDYISPNQFAVGGIYKWNRSKRHSYRASLIFSDLEGNDVNSDDPRRIQRGYEFSTKIIEISAGMEFTFIDFNLHSGRKIATPYLYTGISVAHHDNSYFLNGVQTDENNSSWAYGIPMALGFKTNFLGNLILGIEVGARYTFSDELDGSFPDDASHFQNRFGNINNNDWYVFSGITLTYTFGENPCYCVN